MASNQASINKELFSQEEIILISDDKSVTVSNKKIEIINKRSSTVMYWEEVEKIEVYKYTGVYSLLLSLVLVFLFEQFFLSAPTDLFFMIQLLPIIIIFLVWLVFHRSVISLISITGKRINITVNFRARKKLPELKNKLEAIRKNQPGILTP